MKIIHVKFHLNLPGAIVLNDSTSVFLTRIESLGLDQSNHHIRS